MFATQELQRIMELLDADYDSLDTIQPNVIESPYTLDPITRFETPGESQTLSTAPSFNTPEQIDRMSNTPDEKRLARRIRQQQTPGSSGQFQSFQAETMLDQMTSDRFVKRMLAKEGLDYEWGATGQPDPVTGVRSFDCSGIIYRILQNAGFSNVPRTSGEIYEHSQKISKAKAMKTRGAILWREGHIEVSLGNGKTIGAGSEGTGVRIGTADQFTHGGLLPELVYVMGKNPKPNAKARKRIRSILQTPLEQRVDVTDMPLDPLVALPMPIISVVGEMKAMARSTDPRQQDSVAGLGFVPKKFRSLFVDAAKKYGLDSRLLAVIAKHESAFDPKAVSSAGAQGLMQIMPLHGLDNPFSPKENVMAGARILASYLNKAGGNLRLALAFYNAGPNASRELIEARMSAYSDPILQEFRGEAVA